MPEQPEQEPTPVQLVPVDVEVPVVYSNFVNVTISPHDFTFHFSHYALPPMQARPDGTVEVPVRPLVRVAVPLNLVRAIIRLLQQQVEGWEKNFDQELPRAPGGTTIEDQETARRT